MDSQSIITSADMSFVGSSAMAIVLVALELPFGLTDLVISHDYEWNLLDPLAFTSYSFVLRAVCS